MQQSTIILSLVCCRSIGAVATQFARYLSNVSLLHDLQIVQLVSFTLIHNKRSKLSSEKTVSDYIETEMIIDNRSKLTINLASEGGCTFKIAK